MYPLQTDISLRDKLKKLFPEQPQRCVHGSLGRRRRLCQPSCKLGDWQHVVVKKQTDWELRAPREPCDFRDPRFPIRKMKRLVWGTAKLPARSLRPQFGIKAFSLGLYSSVSQSGDSDQMNLAGAFDDTGLPYGRLKCKIVFHSSWLDQGGSLNLVLMYFSHCLNSC